MSEAARRTTAAAAALAGLWGAAAFGQVRPATEVYLAEWSKNGPGRIVNISDNAGFDGQPQFLANGQSILFASNRDGRQTDIYRYDIRSRRLERLTKSDESEYCPAPLPDGSGFAAVRVEDLGAQRLWQFDADGSNPRVLFGSLKPVGGSLWIDAARVALYVLDAKGGPAAIRLGDAATGQTTLIESSVGRSLALRPRTTQFSFVSEPVAGRTPWTVKVYDWTTREASDLLPALAGAEDVAWLSENELLTAKGAAFYRWRIGEDLTAWTRLPDLPSPRFANITRVTASPDGRWVAFVAEPQAPK